MQFLCIKIIKICPFFEKKERKKLLNYLADGQENKKEIAFHFCFYTTLCIQINASQEHFTAYTHSFRVPLFHVLLTARNIWTFLNKNLLR